MTAQNLSLSMSVFGPCNSANYGGTVNPSSTVNSFCVTSLHLSPLTLLILVGGEELKWYQLAHYQLMSQQGPHYSQYPKIRTSGE